MSKSLYRMNCTEYAIISCTSIERNGNTYLLKMSFSPCNYCLIHRIFLISNKPLTSVARSLTREFYLLFFCFTLQITIKFDARNGYATAIIPIKITHTRKFIRNTNDIAKNVCRHEMGQVFLCDCILSILLLCAINIICFVYLLRTCTDSCRCWLYQCEFRLSSVFHTCSSTFH